MSFTTGGLFLNESLEVARLHRDGESWEDTAKRALEQGTTTLPKSASNRRSLREITNRLRTLTKQERNFLSEEADRTDQQALLWLATCRTYRFVAEFSENVIRDRYFSYQMDLPLSAFDIMTRKTFLQWSLKKSSLASQIAPYLIGFPRNLSLFLDNLKKLKTIQTSAKALRYPKQSDFYIDQAAEFRRRDQKVVVVISDALRFEVAEECLREIRKLNRFDAELKPMISNLPSYTQLGMAALLPNKGMTLSGDAAVSSFGDPTQGTKNREKILGKGRDGDRAKAMKADEFMAMKADEGKALFRDHDVLYLYHNRIDIVGDKLATEDRTTEAAEDAIEDLTKLVRKLTTANFSNILITADHGFLYQHRPLDEAEFSVADPTGSEILLKNRRFVIGHGLNETAGMKKFTSGQLGLAGDLDILIPNSINRMRIKGAGSRFVHGGATLQEIIIPVLRVGKRREADIGQVDVQIIAPSRNLISSGQTAVALYQAQPVSEKQQQRDLLAGIYAQDGTLISDEHQMTFDFTSQNPREREFPVTFLLSREADRFNNQDVFLKLRERVRKTSHFEDYASHRFQLRRGISTDFDF
jgi:uncharacterized protein (TIGR02687 family)